MCACRSKCTYWMGATAPQRCELFVNYFAVYLTGRSSKWEGDRIFLDLLWQNAPFFLLTLRYHGDTLVEAVLNGEKIR